MRTKQTDFWEGQFGREYNQRNSYDRKSWDEFYLKTYGHTKLQMNEEFLAGVPKDASILEIGSNIGLQLIGLQRMGYQNLYGIEIQSDAVEKSKKNAVGINIIKGSGLDIPFKDKYFEVVFTSGVLIHIAPYDLPKVMREMVRCSKRFIWGFEYFAEEVNEIEYRGNEGFLWKADYAQLFADNEPELELVKKTKYSHIGSENVDCMYLLKKEANGNKIL